MSIELKYIPNAKAKKLGLVPIKHYADDAGWDLPVCWPEYLGPEQVVIYIEPGEVRDIPCGMTVLLPTGYWAEVKARGSSFLEKQLHIHDAVVDGGFTGELQVAIKNMNYKPIPIRDGDRIAQLILHKTVSAVVVETTEIPETLRGINQLGSTDKGVANGVRSDTGEQPSKS